MDWISADKLGAQKPGALLPLIWHQGDIAQVALHISAHGPIFILSIGGQNERP